MVARIARDLVARIRELTVQERALEREITTMVKKLAPRLLALPGVGALIAAKIVAETADIRRFRSKDAFARHNGTAPLPVWSSNRVRHRLSRTGNRQHEWQAALRRPTETAIPRARIAPASRCSVPTSIPSPSGRTCSTPNLARAW